MSLVKSITQVGGLTLISRVLGFVRDVLMARFLGASLVADCFFVAFKLPNFFRRLFAEGAFASAFVPIYTGLLGAGSEAEQQKAKGFAEQALAILLPILIVFTVLMIVLMPWVMLVLAPGFADQPEKFNLAIELTRNSFPYLMLISLVSLMASVLNGMKRFAAAAAAPILLNVVLISSLLVFHDSQLIAGQWLSRAVTIAGAVQLLWMMLALRRAGTGLRWRLPKLSPEVRELGVLILPIALGAGAVQLNLLIDIVLASFLPEGSLSYLFYADRLNQLPIGVIGVAVGTVLLPTLSASIASGNAEAAVRDQNRAIETALLLTLPAAAALMVVPLPLITVLFERGAFDGTATANTAAALIAYAAGLPAYILIKALAPAFFARKDSKTPVKLGLIALLINFVLNIILMQSFAHVGLAMATAISAWSNVTMLYVTLRRRELFEMDERLKTRGLRMLLATGLMAVVCWGLTDLMLPMFSGATVERILAISILVVAGLLSYGIFAQLFGAMQWGELRQIFRKKRAKV